MKQEKTVKYIGFEKLCKRGVIGQKMVPTLNFLGDSGNCTDISKYLSLPVEKILVTQYLKDNKITFSFPKDSKSIDILLNGRIKTQIKLRAGVLAKKGCLPNLHLENTRRMSGDNIKKSINGHLPYSSDEFELLIFAIPERTVYEKEIILDYSKMNFFLVPSKHFIENGKIKIRSSIKTWEFIKQNQDKWFMEFFGAVRKPNLYPR